MSEKGEKKDNELQRETEQESATYIACEVRASDEAALVVAICKPVPKEPETDGGDRRVDHVLKHHEL
eukprot:2782160-Rhodomonas_salina.2